MNQKEMNEHHRLLTALSRKHPGSYVAMVGKDILALGKKQFKVLEKAEKKLGKKKDTIGLYYLPGKKKPLYLLKIKSC